MTHDSVLFLFIPHTCMGVPKGGNGDEAGLGRSLSVPHFGRLEDRDHTGGPGGSLHTFSPERKYDASHSTEHKRETIAMSGYRPPHNDMVFATHSHKTALAETGTGGCFVTFSRTGGNGGHGWQSRR